MEESDGAVTIGWPGYADYHVSTEPPQVRVEMGPISEDEAVRAFVFSVLPLSLPLFGLEPLHGSAVTRDGRTTLILGASGSGKSTLAAALVERGFDFVADDACAVDSDGRVWPGPPALTPRGQDDGELGRYNEKPIVIEGRYEERPLPIASTAILAPGLGAAAEVTPLAGRDAVNAVLGQLRAPLFLKGLRREAELDAVGHVARRPVAAIRYDPPRTDPSTVAAMLVSWLEGVGAS